MPGLIVAAATLALIRWRTMGITLSCAMLIGGISGLIGSETANFARRYSRPSASDRSAEGDAGAAVALFSTQRRTVSYGMSSPRSVRSSSTSR